MNCGVMMWRTEALAGCWLVKTSGGEAMMWRTEALAEDIKIPTVNRGELSSLWEICVFRWNKCGLIAFFDGIIVSWAESLLYESLCLT